MLSVRGEPLFYATWERAVFIHYNADPVALQPCVPFPLDLHDGRAFVSLVAFTMRRMRPRFGGRVGEWLLKPIATHEFLNVRTYVHANNEPGIFFLAEWLSNRLSVPLGPAVFGLPYRHGQIRYDHAKKTREINGLVETKQGCIQYRGALRSPEPAAAAEHGSLAEFLTERYTAFTQRFSVQRMFRVWHEPWQLAPLDLKILDDRLLMQTGSWFRTAQYLEACSSPGVEVWMGRPLIPSFTRRRDGARGFPFSR
jgi:uncharacterized protein YqjF (DUF2071 family)